MNTIPSMFAAVAERNAERTAIVERDLRLTYGELTERIRARAEQIEAMDVRLGDRVGLLLPNGIEYVASYFAIAWLGGVIVPLNDQYQRNELEYFLDDCDVCVLITASASAELARDVLAKSAKPRRLLLVDDGSVEKRGATTFRPAPCPHVDPRSPMMFQYTSGSTGVPKKIARTHENLVFEMGSLQRTLGIGAEDRFLGVAPFSHVNGLMRSMMASILSGASLYPLPKFDRQATVAAIETHRLTMFIAVPFMFSMLAKSRFPTPPDFSSLRLCISASAPMPNKLNRLFHEKFGLYVRQLYGSTETGTISVNLADDVEATLDSVGTPAFGVHVAVVADDGSTVSPGEMAEIAVTSPGAIRGYEGLDEVNREVFRNGCFLTGDLGRMDANGVLTLVGRKKFFINKGGYKIDPHEIEELLASHPSVEEVAVVGVPTPFGDEKVKAVAVLCGDCTELELIEHCRGRIAEFKIPSVIEFRESLPKSSTGKIRKTLL